ncbi:MAG: sialate O-acetylesterase [Tepidisphaeraceae bacterium]
MFRKPFKWSCCVISAAVLLWGPVSVRAANYDVYVLAGQSNMDGRGRVSELVGPLAKYAVPREDILLTYGNSTLRQKVAITSCGWVALRPGYSVSPGAKPSLSPHATFQATPGSPATHPTAAAVAASYVPSKVFGPEIGFGFAMADARKPNSPRLALIKFAVGNTNLREAWNPDTRGQLYDQMIAFIHQSLATLTANGDTYTFRGFLWHQGEADTQVPVDRYEQLLTNLIKSVRRDLNSPDLPVVLGEPFDNGKSLNIRAAQRATAAKVPNVYWVSSAGLKALDRGTHFSTASQIELGQRFAEAILNKADAGPIPTTAPAVTNPPTTEPVQDEH